MKTRKHAEMIKAWADNIALKVEYRDPNHGYWAVTTAPAWDASFEYRIKPAEPEKVYPVTNMTKEEISGAYHSHNGNVSESWVATANAAIRRAIDDGQVYTKEQLETISIGFMLSELEKRVEEWEVVREQRDMAVAKAVWKEAQRILP